MELPCNKILILVRHAHRDTSRGRSLDNGLSKKGLRQAKRIKKMFYRRFGDEVESVSLLSSPKLRCRETLAPLAELVSKRVENDELLLEQSETQEESMRNLESRIQTFIQRWTESTDLVTVACSHGDWLPLALKQLVGASASFKKGAWAEVEIKSGRTRLTWLVQEP